MLDGIAESASDRFLARNFVKGLGTPFPSDYLIGHGYFLEIGSELARPRTFPQHTLPLLPLLRSRPGGVHKASVVRSPGSDKNFLAERVGFEPTERFPVHSISSAASSTTPAPLLRLATKSTKVFLS